MGMDLNDLLETTMTGMGYELAGVERPARSGLLRVYIDKPGGVTQPSGSPRSELAEELRGRLGNFQRGLSRGRRSVAERGAANGYPENEQQESE